MVLLGILPAPPGGNVTLVYYLLPFHCRAVCYLVDLERLRRSDRPLPVHRNEGNL